MPKLILLRHLQSRWNLENRFTGWTDVPLSREGILKARDLAEKISEMKIDVVFTSPLVRNIDTVLKIWDYIENKYPIFIHFGGRMEKWGNFEKLNDKYIPVYVSEDLNERYYGQLQGLNKKEMMDKYGFEKIQLWRRSYDVKPPGGESLKDVVKRASSFFKKNIEKKIKEGKNILIVASHNSLRALVKHLENVSDKDIVGVEIDPGSFLDYELDNSLKIQNKIVIK